MTNNKQQTAVQWFLDQLIEHRIIIVNRTTYQVKYKHEMLLEQAKAMHKEEIIRAWKKGDGQFDKVSDKMSLEYYNETYGGVNK
jgi:hypothetical protein